MFWVAAAGAALPASIPAPATSVNTPWAKVIAPVDNEDKIIAVAVIEMSFFIRFICGFLIILLYQKRVF